MKSHGPNSSHEILISQQYLSAFTNEDGLWHEPADEVRQALRLRARDVKRLARVREAMDATLTARERRCIELHYFDGCTLREVGERTETSAAAAQRAIQRAIRKLRAAVVAGQEGRNDDDTRG